MENSDKLPVLRRTPHIKAKFSKLTLSSAKKLAPITIANPAPKVNTPTQAKKMLSFTSSTGSDHSLPTDVVNNIMRSSSSLSVTSKSYRLSSQPFSERLEISDTDATHCSLITNDSDSVLDTEMGKLELMESSSDIFAASERAESTPPPPLQTQRAKPNSTVNDVIGELSEQVANLELPQNLSCKESQTFRKELYNSILTISSTSAPKEKNIQSDDTRSSLNSEDIFECISIIDSSDSDVEAVGHAHIESSGSSPNVSTVCSHLSNSVELPSQVIHKLNHFFDNIPAVTTGVADVFPVDKTGLSLKDSENLGEAKDCVDPETSVCSSSSICESVYVSETEEEVLQKSHSDSELNQALPSPQKKNKPTPIDSEEKSTQPESQLIRSTQATSDDCSSGQFNIPKINVTAKFCIRIELSGFDSSDSSDSTSASIGNSENGEGTDNLKPIAESQPDDISLSQKDSSVTATNFNDKEQLETELSGLKIGNSNKLTSKNTNRIILAKTGATPKPMHNALNIHSPVGSKNNVPLNSSSTRRRQEQNQETSTPRKPASVKKTASEKLSDFITPKPRVMSRKRTPPAPTDKQKIELDDTAQRLLNELYGKTWQTPELLNRCVAKTCATEKPAPKSPVERPKSRSSHNFSLFRKNILSDLESTRIIPTVNESVSNTTLKTSGGSSCRTVPETPSLNERTRSSSFAEIRSIRKKVANRILDSDSDERKSKEGSLLTNDDSKGNDSRRSKRKSKRRIGSLFDYDADFTASSDDSSSDSDFHYKNKKNASERKSKSLRNLTYLDLTSHTMIVDEEHCAPNASDKDLEAITERFLKSIIDEDKENEVLPSVTPVKSKRKLFTPNYEIVEPVENDLSNRSERNLAPEPSGEITWNSGGAPASLFKPPNFVKKILEHNVPKSPFPPPAPPALEHPAVQTPKLKLPPAKNTPKGFIPLNTQQRLLQNIKQTPKEKYGFLRSLDVFVPRAHCHPDALLYRDRFKQKRDELLALLMQLYNEEIFDGKLDVPVKWNKMLKTTAGLCSNRRRGGIRSASIELSDKVVTSCDRLRSTLIHELCHAATWVFTGEKGHGPTWKAWAQKAMQIFTDLPIIDRCHNYEIEYKYTYKCTLCGAKSKSHSKSKKVELIRCAFCHGSIEILLNKKDKEGNAIETPVRKASGFALFVKERYNVFKAPGVSHAEVMQLLSGEYSQLSSEQKKKY